MISGVAFDSGGSLTGVGEEELLGALRELEVAERRLSAAQVRRMACDAKVIPAVLGSASEHLDIGRSTRRNTLHTHRTRGTAAPPNLHQPGDTATCDPATHTTDPWDLNPWTTRARAAC